MDDGQFLLIWALIAVFVGSAWLFLTPQLVRFVLLMWLQTSYCVDTFLERRNGMRGWTTFTRVIAGLFLAAGATILGAAGFATLSALIRARWP